LTPRPRARLDDLVPDYQDLDPLGRPGPEWRDDEPARARAVSKLLELRRALTEGAGAPPPRRLNSLLIGTWNLREFDSTTWGARVPETYAYIAEIIDRFDLVAVQEIRADLRALERLMQRLGPSWRYLVSDVTRGTAGNGERLGFLYDTNKVQFLGMAGELVLPPITTDGRTVPVQQIARTPLMAAFQVGWTRFVLATVHILFGPDSAEPLARVEEIRQVARFLRERVDDPDEPTRNFIALGDFNIFNEGDATMRALTEEGGFTVPEGMTKIPGTNVPRNKKYDQIAFRSAGGFFEATGAAGAFDFYEHVFRADESAAYRPYIDGYIAARAAAGKRSPKPPGTGAAALTQFKTWRTYQMSDHLPLWAEFRVDFADDYLAKALTPPPVP
jgi:endonuclease/exonuclease/phosphatase family metal-dependent hydrolase